MNNVTFVGTDNEHNYLNFININEFNIKKVKTDYIIFMDTLDDYTEVNFEDIINFMRNNELSLYALYPNYYFKEKKHEALFNKKIGFINMSDEIYNLYLSSFVIETKIIKKILTNNNCTHSAEELLINIYDSVDKYYQSDITYLKKLNIILEPTLFSNYSNKKWYKEDIETLTKYALNNKKEYIRNLIFNIYLLRIFVNKNQSSNGMLNDSEYEEFVKVSKELFSELGHKYIDKSNFDKNISIPHYMKYFFTNIIFDEKDYKIKNDKLLLNDTCIENIDDVKVDIQLFNHIGNEYVFDAILDGTVNNIFPVKVLLNGKPIKHINTNIFSKKKLFGKEFHKDYTFKFSIDENSLGKLEFDISNRKLNIEFQNVHSRLSNGYSFSYYNNNKRTFVAHTNSIEIEKRNIFKSMFYELKFYFAIIKQDQIKKTIKGIGFRIIYFITHPLLKNKDIWITYDKVYKSGDCGEYFYRYARKQNKNIYYLISNKAKYYNKIKRETQNVLNYNSIKSKIYALNCKKMIITDSISINTFNIYPYYSNIFRNLMDYEVYHIQHGLTMQDIAIRQNRLFDNVKKYYVASKYEVENLLKPEYGFDKAAVKLTGIPRFDGLKNKPENYILLSPTWRVDIVSNNAKDRVRLYNDNFKNTEYFKLFNSFINNKKVIKLLKEHDFKMIFLIHPTLINNKKDYDKNDYVEILSAADVNYEDILVKAKLMISDYSGVQYDFAYMNKPIIYYHSPLLPPSYNDGMMNYESMGFGPICETEEQLVGEIEKLFNNSFENDKMYIKRSNAFFKYKDFDNCKRIYEDIVGSDQNDKDDN